MGLTVTVLGCSGTYAGPGGACSGYLLDDGRTRVWVEAGSGTLANLQRHVGLDQVDAVVLSHEHPDHWTDVEGFYYARRFLHPPGLPVYAPAGLSARTYQDHAPHLEWHDVAEGDRVAVGTMRFTFSRTDHGPETLAVRVESDEAPGRALGYSADTGPGWSLEALGSGLSLALCEATLPVGAEGTSQHLSARQAGQSARDAGVGRLVLTHLWPMLDPDRSREEGSEAFGQPVEVAVLHERYEA